jgi:hypothetical protein
MAHVNWRAKRKLRPVPLARDLEVTRDRGPSRHITARVHGSTGTPIDLPAADLHHPRGRQFRDHALINSGRPLYDPTIGSAGRYRPE